MIDHDLVRRTLRKQLLTTSDLPGDPPDTRIAVENRPFKPPALTDDDGKPMWIQETYMPGEETKIATNLLQCVAVVQYDVMTPAGKGTEAAEQLAKRIADAIPAGWGIQITEPRAVQISVFRSGRLPGQDAGTISGSAWWKVPVRINLRSYAPNQEA